MKDKSSKWLFRGLLKALLLTAGAIIIYSMFNFFIPSTEKIKNPFILIVSLISILYGAYYAARKSQKKGWIIGINIALLYSLIFYLFSIAGEQDFKFTKSDILRILIALVVGMLSGMLGIISV